MATDFNEHALYNPSDIDKETINKLYDRLQSVVQMRNKSYSYFNNRSLTSYIDESMKRWNGFIPPKDDLSLDWQSHVFNNLTRNACISLLSKIAMQRPKARFIATNSDGFQDTLRAHILEKAIEYTRQRENGDWKFFQVALECITKGTVVAYEGYRKIKRKVREIKKYDPITGKVEYEEKEIIDFDDCFQEVIPLEEIYFGNLWVSDIQQQPDIIWKHVVMKQAFFDEYKKYPNSKYVKAGTYAIVVETIPYYKQKEYFQLDKNSVEIIQWYNKSKDRLVVTANGVLLYDGPIPFAHKRYPFAHTIFEPFAIDFIYGRSLPDKMSSDQDIVNTLWNMMIDQSVLSIYKPTLTDDPDYIEEYPLQPGRMFPVSDINKYRVMNELTGPDASHFQILQMALKFSNDNSGNLLGGGGAFAQQKGNPKARQMQIQEEQMRQVLGLNTKMLENFDIQATTIRAKNFLQFYTNGEKVHAMTGEKDAMSKFTRVLRIESTELSDGTHGTAILKMVDKAKNLPSQDALNTEEEVASMQGENIEVHAITADYIRNTDFDVQIVGESSFTQSKSLKQAMTLELVTQVSNNPMFAPLLNGEELLREVLTVYDKDSEKLMKAKTPPPDMQGAPGQPPQGGQPPGGQPTPQMASQIKGAPQASLSELQ